MNDIKVSIVASAVRTQFWPELLLSLRENLTKYEVIFAGDRQPSFNLALYPEFKYIYSPTKPAQCYEIAARAAVGETIHWTCDDAIYVYDNYRHNIDKAYNAYKSFNNNKVIIAMRPIEDGGDVWDFHHFFGGSHDTPVMAPLGLMNREFFHQLGGYDRRYISGQSENDVVMRAREAGGWVEICMDAYIYIGHRRAHETPNPFRQWYTWDRSVLEKSWVLPDGRISPTRLDPVERFEDENLITTTQGPRGKW